MTIVDIILKTKIKAKHIETGEFMKLAVISGKGIFTPENIITNDELVESFNTYVDEENAKNKHSIQAGEMEALTHSSADFIFNASGIRQRYVMNKTGILDPEIMHPQLRQRSDDEPSIMAEMALDACKKALDDAGKTAADVDAVIVACSNLERAYPAVSIEIQKLLGISGFGFDMNVACSSATFGIQMASNMITAGSVRSALIVSPEICSAHLEWRDRDCHFIFGDVCTAVFLEEKSLVTKPHFNVISTRCATQFSNNIRNNNGYLRRTRPDEMTDRRDMQFMQNGRKVFKEVLPIVGKHMLEHLHDENLQGDDMKRLWLHQANKTMNDFIGKKVMGRTPTTDEQPNILQDYANTSSAGSIIAFAKYCEDLSDGDLGIICSFGAGYSVGSVLLKRSSS